MGSLEPLSAGKRRLAAGRGETGSELVRQVRDGLATPVGVQHARLRNVANRPRLLFRLSSRACRGISFAGLRIASCGLPSRAEFRCCAAISRPRTPADLSARSPVLGSVGRRSGDRTGPNAAVWRPTPNSPGFLLPRGCVGQSDPQLHRSGSRRLQQADGFFGTKIREIPDRSAGVEGGALDFFDADVMAEIPEI